VTPRDLALAALEKIDRGGGFAERHLERAFNLAPRLDDRDRAFTFHLIQGVLRWRLRLDWIIEHSAHFPFSKIEPQTLNILRVALYQIFFMDRVPESAAVDEAVKQTRRLGRRHLGKFVNGILREICRRKDQIAFPDPVKEWVAYLSVYYSYPQWLVRKWIRELGNDAAERLLEAQNRIPGPVVRVNSLRAQRSSLIHQLAEEGVKGKPTPYSPDGVCFEGPIRSIPSLVAFKKGLFQPQSEAAQICSHLLCPRPGERVLDLCAGLGGKSTHISQLMRDQGWIIALDMSPKRLVSLRENSRRLGMCSIMPVAADASRRLSSLFKGTFHRILVDAPCSALGILSRHPDGKWFRDESDIRRLAQLQRKILQEAAPLLRRGGRMLYVTCTISKEENERVVASFLERERSMALEDLKDHAPSWAQELIDEGGFFKPSPHVHGLDGFFAALFTKRDTGSEL